MGWSRSLLFSAAAILIAGSVWYVVAPPRTAGDYHERAALTAQTLRSQVESARLWVEAVESDRVTREAATVAFREAEDDAAAAASEFSAWDPIGDSRDLRSEVTALAADVSDALAALRIAAEDERWNELPHLVERLPQLAEKLDRVARSADP
jgi:hypothetical protein